MRDRKLKILVSSLYFHPDHSGIALYSTDLSAFFAEKGHEVTVVAAFPFYPHWKKQERDRGRLFGSADYEGVRLLRGYLYVPQEVTTLKRMLHELSFTVFASLNFLRAGRHDCTVILSPPLLLGLVGVVFKYLWRSQLVFHVQDLQTDAAECLGMIRQKGLIRALRRVENFICQHSTWVVSITHGMWQRLMDKGVPEAKLGLYYNWIDVAEACTPRPSNRFRSQHPHLKSKFLVAYAGNVGVKQGLDVLVTTAEMMQSEPSVHLLIIGEGADKPRLEALAAEKKLKNLTLLPFLTQREYFEMLQDIDVSFVAQKPNTGSVFFPSKLLGVMAMSKPLLISADLDSELASVIREAECGLVSAAEDVEALVRNIQRLQDNANLRDDLGRSGRMKVQEFDRSTVLSGFLARIELEHQRRSTLGKVSVLG